jgi:hypothetical protein
MTKFTVNNVRRKFEVNNERLKFEVNTSDLSEETFPQEEANSRFRINGVTLNDRITLNDVPSGDHVWNFAHQTDGNSCGYCVIHNISNILPLNNYDGNPESIFQAVNETRERFGTPQLDRNQNLPTANINTFLYQQGLSTDIVSGQDALNELQEGFDAAVVISGGHYTAFVRDESGLWFELDSLRTAPVLVPENSAMDAIRERCFDSEVGTSVIFLRKNES